jgi:hypothetical protein
MGVKEVDTGGRSEWIPLSWVPLQQVFIDIVFYFPYEILNFMCMRRAGGV